MHILNKLKSHTNHKHVENQTTLHWPRIVVTDFLVLPQQQSFYMNNLLFVGNNKQYLMSLE